MHGPQRPGGGGHLVYVKCICLLMYTLHWGVESENSQFNETERRLGTKRTQVAVTRYLSELEYFFSDMHCVIDNSGQDYVQQILILSHLNSQWEYHNFKAHSLQQTISYLLFNSAKPKLEFVIKLETSKQARTCIVVREHMYFRGIFFA